MKPARESLLTGVNLQQFYNSLGSANILNYVQDSKGITFSASYPILRTFARVEYRSDMTSSNITTESTGAANLLQLHQISVCRSTGPKCATGIKTLSLTPSYSW